MTEGIRQTKQPNWGTGTRPNSTDREAMIEAFLQHFTEPRSKKAAGQLFDKPSFTPLRTRMSSLMKYLDDKAAKEKPRQCRRG
jgi:hypothetical protein